MAVDGYSYCRDYLEAVLSKASEHVSGGVSEDRFRSAVYHQWWAGKSVKEAAREVLRWIPRIENAKPAKGRKEQWIWLLKDYATNAGRA